MVRGERVLLLGYSFLMMVLMPLGMHAAETEQMLRTDSRAPYVHRISLNDAGGQVISPKGESVPPYSPKATCGKCHDLERIRSGWHFNAPDPNAPPGRAGEPWILTDIMTGTQLPVSSRQWPGTYRPMDVGLTPWQFILTFGQYTPGGGLGEKYSEKPEDPKARWKVSGHLEIDCLSCHSADPSRDETQRGRQIESQNFKWAPVAAEGLAIVRGSAKEGAAVTDILAEADPAAAEHASANVKVIYDTKRFDANERVFFNIARKPPSVRCYFCHSSHEAGEEGREWDRDEDVHLAKGMTCADCHRNGLDHAITRGDEVVGPPPGETASQRKGTVSAFSCRGCHATGRMGAPQPRHSGLPHSHLETLTCTACHSGLLPVDRPHSVRTARAHGLGIPSMHRRDDVPPFVVEPVLVRQADGKIAPHRMMWPAFWGWLKGETVLPLAPGVVSETAREALGVKDGKSEDWKPLTEEQVAKTLKALSAKKSDAGEAVYVCGGRLYRLTADGKIAGSDHVAASPYSWPLAHDVRPAAQSLGSGGCTDCHAEKAGFFYCSVTPQSPAQIGKPTVRLMYELQGLKLLEVQAWNQSVRYRHIWSGTSLVALGILAIVFAGFVVVGLGAILRAIFVRNPSRFG
jgi:hypothetical protein